jgi:hypothetical protein
MSRGSSVPRVRHHTDDEGLEGIRAAMAINPSRGSAGAEAGVHVELEPYGSPRPGREGPRETMGCVRDGAFVEFDAPLGMLRTYVGIRNTAIIPTPIDEPFALKGRNVQFVRVRRHFWEFWRSKPQP